MRFKNYLLQAKLATAAYASVLLAAALGIFVAATGCSSGPSRVAPPSIDADDAAETAVEMYDKDGDGFIAGAELDAVPGVKAAMETIDVNPKDSQVSAEEIEARINSWQKSAIGIMAVNCSITLDGRTLTGATVTFEPESFLGDDIKAGVADIGAAGTAMVSIPKDQRPSADTPPGLQLGLYRVRISKKSGGQEQIPAKYNTDTILGQQVSPDDPAIASQRVRFELSSN